MIFGINKDTIVEESPVVKETNSIMEPIVNLGPVLRYLSQSKGKLEIAFQKNENPIYESLCLAFVKIPIYGEVINILREMIKKDVSDSFPL